MSIENVKNLLEAKGVKPSFQRISVLKYLLQENNHPSVDTIYKNLVSQIPTLSRTTVYNTLKLLSEKEVISTLSISNTDLRFDFVGEPHDHFQCNTCGKIYDIYEISDFSELKTVDGHQVQEMQLHLKGTCNRCLESLN
ncbi:MAG: transcriptional repressor [Calditrichaeota bacterium]|nr:MAG: transcriptional repressor [Calditrichota bacterium]